MPDESRIGRYELGKRLGYGDFSYNGYESRDPISGREVGVQVIPEPFVASVDRTALLNEVRRLVAISHPRLVRVLDFEEEGPRLFLVHEPFPGPVLLDVIKDGKRTLPRSLRRVQSLCEALAAAHEHSLVYRHFWPDNAYVAADDAVRLDVIPAALAWLEKPVKILGGAVFYFSPEQVQGQDADARSNVFVAGCIAYRCLTGSIPFEAMTFHGRLFNVLKEDPVPPRHHEPGIPEEVERWLLTALAKDPAARFPDGGALSRALREALG